MAVKIIDGKNIAIEIRAELKAEIEGLKNQGIYPGLAVVQVGDNPASEIYVRNKEKACIETGIYSVIKHLPTATTQEELLALVATLNNDPRIHGILVQLPLPKHLDAQAVISSVTPVKDVDGIGPTNIGNLMVGAPCFYPCTPYGCMVLLDRIGVTPLGKKAVIIGRSNIVGKPMAMMLLHRHATVTVCHTRTPDLEAETRQADILVVAAGKPLLVNGAMIKEGATVIDVGMNRQENGKVFGDVDFASVAQVAGWLTPVPGGVGPMTITMLLKNTVEAAKWQCLLPVF
jgi:methylenetetrahydrofolate dehydrogenase (NADP+)/methenyltetrahydrofolate cyclohydrolase